MLRVVVYFILLTLLFGIGISTVRQLTGKEQLELIKLIGYSIMCGLLAFSALVAIVILF